MTSAKNTQLSPTMLRSLTNLAAIGGRVEGYLEPMRKAGIHGGSIDALVRRGLVELVPSMDAESNVKDYVITDAGRAIAPVRTVDRAAAQRARIASAKAKREAREESATEVDPSPAPRLSLPFEPSYYPNSNSGTDIRDGNGEIVGHTWYHVGMDFVATVEGENIGTYETDDEAIHAVLVHYGTPIEHEVTIPVAAPRSSNLRPVTPAIAASREARAKRIAAREESASESVPTSDDEYGEPSSDEYVTPEGEILCVVECAPDGSVLVCAPHADENGNRLTWEESAFNLTPERLHEYSPEELSTAVQGVIARSNAQTEEMRATSRAREASGETLADWELELIGENAPQKSAKSDVNPFWYH